MRVIKHGQIIGLILSFVVALMAVGANPESDKINARQPYRSCYLRHHPHVLEKDGTPALLAEVRHSLWLVGEFPRCGPVPLMVSVGHIRSWLVD